MGPLLAAAAAAAARTRACRGAVSPASSSVTLLTCTVRVPPSIRAASTAARRARAKPRILSAVSCASRRRPATSARRSWRAVVPAMRIAWRAARCMGSTCMLATAHCVPGPPAAARTRARRGAVSPASSSVTPLTCTVRVPPISRAASTAAPRAPSTGEIADPRGGIVCLSPAPRHLGQEVLEGGGARAMRIACESAVKTRRRVRREAL